MLFSTKQELIKYMGIGWNLGNVLQAFPYETSWQQPAVTKALIQKVKSLGFNTIRVPITWLYHCGPSPEYTINQIYLDRIAEVVDNILEEDMIAIINIHSEPLLSTDENNFYSEYSTMISALWSQITEYFINYDERLVFECMNEIRCTEGEYSWWINTNTDEGAALITDTNLINQLFVDTVRAQDTNRYLIVAPYCSSAIFAANNLFIMPTDAFDKTCLAYHCYAPAKLCLEQMQSTFTEEDKTAIDEDFNFHLGIIKNINTACIITETGIPSSADKESRYNWAKYITQKYLTNNIPIIFWDNGGADAYGFFDRGTLETYPESERYLQGIFEGYNA